MNPAEALPLLELRVGRIVDAALHESARKSAFKLSIDFGPLGIKNSSAQLTANYQPTSLIGRQVIAVMNLGSRAIAGFESEVLVLGLPDANGNVILLRPERDVLLGGRVF